MRQLQNNIVILRDWDNSEFHHTLLVRYLRNTQVSTQITRESLGIPIACNKSYYESGKQGTYITSVQNRWYYLLKTSRYIIMLRVSHVMITSLGHMEILQHHF
ncbi:hypothetical protein ANAPH2_01135 [Anaplasma phagocytophilum]|nr:hypothetical protein ANAPH2_01135 [Anaplasma phagocytophilum]